MADTETETTAAPAKTLTGYVLFECDDRGAWMPVMHVHSRKAEDAITEYIEHELGTDEEPGGMFAAVPARSWRPMKVTAKQTTTLDLKPAT